MAIRMKTKVHWVGNASLIRELSESPLVSDNLRFIEFEEHRSSETIECLLLILSELSSTHLEMIRAVKKEHGRIPTIIVFESDPTDILVDLIHIGFQVTPLLFPFDKLKIFETIQENTRHSIEREERSILLKKSRTQFRTLETLTGSLERIVEERTASIYRVNREESEKLSRETQIVKFIRKLNRCDSVEEVFLNIRQEIIQYNHLADPFLGIIQRSQEIRQTLKLTYLKNGQITEAQIADFPKIPDDPQIADLEWTEFLVDHFQRPFLKVHVVPLFSRMNFKIILFLESKSDSSQVEGILEFVLDRAQGLVIALERILLENQKLEYTYRWERAFDEFFDPIAIISKDFKVLRANSKFSSTKKMTETRDVYLSGETSDKCHKLFMDSGEICLGCPVSHTISSRKPQVGRVQRGQNYEVYSYPVTNSTGDFIGVVNQYIDNSEATQLYVRVLQNEKMSAIGSLAGNIAHELNNPLTGIRSLAEVLGRPPYSPFDSQIGKDLNEIEKAAGRCQNIISNLLDFSKLNGPSDSKNLRPILVDELIMRTLPLLKSFFRRIQLVTNFNCNGCEIFVEPSLLQQVIFNLVNNACQAMGDKGRVTISTIPLIVNEKETQIELKIVDTGPGIPLEFQNRIFEPFFTTKSEGKGTGLGLSISKQIIERLNGKISFTSSPNIGTEFILKFKACK